MGVYADDGVDFEKEHTAVEVFKALYKATKAYTADLKEYGISPPDDIGYFSDGISVDTKKLAKAVGGRKITMVFGMDGAGTKPKAHLAYLTSKRGRAEVDAESDVAGIAEISRASVGIDTMAMVVNDVLCGGARTMYILDYIAWEDIDIKIARDLAAGLREGARQSGSTIVGGENASLREMINGYDICASAMGMVLNPYYIDNPLTGEAIKVGDAIIGIGSSGVHCNGISTVRKKLIRFPDFGWEGRYEIDEVVPELGKTAAEEILTPTIIYKEPVLDGVLGDRQFTVKAMVNVTGEGIHNLRRALTAKNTGAIIDVSKEEKLRAQPVFDLIQREGKITDREMWEVYNMGIGMEMIVPREQAEAVIDRVEEYKVGGVQMQASIVGEILEDPDQRIKLKTGRFEDVF